MPRVAELLSEGATLAVDDPRRDAEVLLCAALAKPRSYLYAWPDAEVADDAAARYRDWLTRRRAGAPVAHLLGRREFWSLSLEIGPDTLIPRPETELLVEAALAMPLPADAAPAASAVDLGTGSGAIALAIASERPSWRVTGVDISEAALVIARRNRQRLALANLELLVGDWFAPLAGRRFDLVISNPPYLAADDPHLACGDLPREPERALVAGETGMAALRKVIEGAPDHLAPGAWLLLEHGMEQAGRVRELLHARGFACVESRRDLAGHERVALGRWPGGEQPC